VQLKLSAVSRIHCNVTVDENGGAQLENLSQNGTDLNGMMLPKQGRCELKHDDTFALGNRRFRFCKANVDAATVAKQAFAPAAADDDTTELPRGMPFALVSKASRQSLGVALAVSARQLTY
jgi:predicted component of type VI protein secretion system